MSDVTMIGLGAMGSALALAFLRAGHALTVWNRSTPKMAPLVDSGASGAGSVADAVEASPVIVVCIDDYAATRALFDAEGVLPRLDGRTLVQLSTGTPQEARDADTWLRQTGVLYVDGAIMPYPEGIGRPDARILFAGAEPAWRNARPVLDCLGGDLRYLGSNVAAAAVLDMTWLTYELCSYLAALHGASVCMAEGVSVGALADMVPEGSPARRLSRVIAAGDFSNPGATLAVWEAALRRVQQQARDAGIDSAVPDLISDLFNRAIAAGHGEEDVAAVVKVLREGR